MLPLSLVSHIDYESASFLFSGLRLRVDYATLDPILDLYFRMWLNLPHAGLLPARRHSTRGPGLSKRFREFDINCIAVLIGPESKIKSAEEDPLRSCLTITHPLPSTFDRISSFSHLTMPLDVERLLLAFERIARWNICMANYEKLALFIWRPTSEEQKQKGLLLYAHDLVNNASLLG